MLFFLSFKSVLTGMGQQSFAYIMSSLLLNWYVDTGKMHNAQTY